MEPELESGLEPELEPELEELDPELYEELPPVACGGMAVAGHNTLISVVSKVRVVVS